MNCEGARDSIILAAYGELPDEDAVGLEQHLTACEHCLQELAAMRALDFDLAVNPMTEPDPNFLAQSRMRLDEALDAIPQHGFLTRLRSNASIWLGHLKTAPAFATLLVGTGFLAGNFTYRYQVANAPKIPGAVILSNQNGGGIATVSGVKELPNNMVQVSYDRVVPEMAQGSLDDPQIRQLLTVGTHAAGTAEVRVDSVALLANECRVGHECKRDALLTSLRTDRNAGVRLKALDGLQPYVSQDEHVRDTVAQVLLTDSSAQVRSRAIDILEPVQSDSTVSQAFRTVSTMDTNPYIRTVSTRALGNAGSMQ